MAALRADLESDDALRQATALLQVLYCLRLGTPCPRLLGLLAPSSYFAPAPQRYSPPMWEDACRMAVRGLAAGGA